LYRVRTKEKDDMQTTRDIIILLLLILVLATIRISPVSEVDLTLSPAHAAVTEADNGVETVEPLATPELAGITPAMLDWQPAECSHSQTADSPSEASPVPLRVINDVLRPTLQRLTNLDVRCSKGEPNTCVVVVRSATKT